MRRGCNRLPGWSRLDQITVVIPLKRYVLVLVGMALLALSGGSVYAQALTPQTSASKDELLLMRALSDVKGERLDAALAVLEELLAHNPDFRLAQLVYADLLLAKTQPLRRFGHLLNANSKKLADLRYEARVRFSRYLNDNGQDTLPEQLLQLSAKQTNAVMIDVERSRLYRFENRAGVVRLVADYYVSTGKNGPSKRREGDQKTPVGVYFMTGRIAPAKLPDFYGTGAFPVNYPNEWDLRNGRTGYGIWIHGVPQATFSRAPRASDGCMALANADLSALWDGIAEDSTPVLIVRDAKWVSRSKLANQAADIRRRIEQWRKDWESLDIDRYANHYSRSFCSDTHDYDSWINRKRA